MVGYMAMLCLRGPSLLPPPRTLITHSPAQQPRSPAALAAPAGAGGEGIKDVGCIQTPATGLTYHKPSTLVIIIIIVYSTI